MNAFEKAILNVTVKPFADREITALKDNEAANIATIQAAIGSGANFVTATIDTLLAGVKADPILMEAVDILAPLLVTELSAVLSGGAQDVPTLYAAGLAFLEKEDSYL